MSVSLTPFIGTVSTRGAAGWGMGQTYGLAIMRLLCLWISSPVATVLTPLPNVEASYPNLRGLLEEHGGAFGGEVRQAAQLHLSLLSVSSDAREDLTYHHQGS